MYNIFFPKLKGVRRVSHLWILLYVSCSSWQRILGSSTADSRHTLPMASWGTTWTGISILSYLVVIRTKRFRFCNNNTAVLRYWVHRYKQVMKSLTPNVSYYSFIHLKSIRKGIMKLMQFRNLWFFNQSYILQEQSMT